MTVLVDTSAWVEFLRGAGGPTADAVRDAVRSGDAATTDQVIAELLAGARDEAEADRLRRLVAALDFHPQATPQDAELAADLYRACRRGGRTPRSLADCLIGAVALRAGLQVLHRDRDFDVLAQFGGVSLA